MTRRLGDKTFRVLRALASGPMRPCELSQALGMSNETIFFALSRLRERELATGKGGPVTITDAGLSYLGIGPVQPGAQVEGNLTIVQQALAVSPTSVFNMASLLPK